MSDLLFNVPRNKTRLQIAKETHGIETHHAPAGVENPWCAIHRQIVEDKFAGYGVTPEMSMGEIFSKVCRLLDESKLVGYGDTEAECVLDLCRNLKIEIIL